MVFHKMFIVTEIRQYREILKRDRKRSRRTLHKKIGTTTWNFLMISLNLVANIMELLVQNMRIYIERESE